MYVACGWRCLRENKQILGMCKMSQYIGRMDINDYVIKLLMIGPLNYL